MKLLEIKVLRGPNYWSNFRKKLIVLNVDLGKFEEKPTNLIPRFSQNLKKILPSLSEHFCSEQMEGGFFIRLDEGTWLGHVIEHVALEMQCLAGMHCGFGRTRSANRVGIYHVIFAYEYESAGIYAAKAAFKLVQALANQKDYPNLAADINKLKAIFAAEKFGPSTLAIVEELHKRHIPYERIDGSLLLLGQGTQQKYILATETSFTSIIGVEIAADKELTKTLLLKNHIPVPNGKVIKSEKELTIALNTFSFPVVIKPQNANHGKGVTCNITNTEDALKAFNIAKTFSKKVIIEEFIQGADYRFLVINYKVVAVAKREPPQIIGNGSATIQELINEINNHPDRSRGHANYLTTIKIDEITLEILRDHQLDLNSILKKDQRLNLKYAANLSVGGTAEDVTDAVHAGNIFLAERIARLVHLDVCGIDMIMQNIAKPIHQQKGAIIEVNAAPGFRMHLAPSKGRPRNVAAAVVDMLYPVGVSARIPIIAVTGTNGKTTVVRMLAYIASAAGYVVGYTTTDGIYINHQEITQGDCSGPLSARVVLHDASVNFAVLECARGGILRSGLGFENCDISIVTNISEDHLGIDHIDTLEELSRVKCVLPRSATAYTILNADDDLVYSMQKEVKCKVALFSQSKSPRILQHLQNGNIVAYVHAQQLFIETPKEKINFGNIEDIPLTFSGQANCMLKNLLPVILAAYLSNFDPQLIKKTLKNFQPNAKLLPGRMNIFSIGNATVLLDYAHNPDAFFEMKKYINTVNAIKKIGIIAATGDRREIDIFNIGKYAAEMFDEIIIRHDKDGRGRSNQELTDLLLKGINAAKKTVSIKVISDEFRAVTYALQLAPTEKSFIFYFPDNIHTALVFLKNIAHNPQQFLEKTV